MLEHRSQLMQLRSLADADIAAFLAAVHGLPVADVRNALIAALPELVAPYVTAAGELAAVMFEDLRVEAARRGTFYADAVSVSLPAARADRTVRWAVEPLAKDALESTVNSRLSGSVARMIMDASRETMQANGARESVRFQRIPRGGPDTCDFCLMLGSRPAWMAYSSEAKAQAGSHDNCHCVIVPLYPGSEMAELASASRKSILRQYADR